MQPAIVRVACIHPRLYLRCRHLPTGLGFATMLQHSRFAAEAAAIAGLRALGRSDGRNWRLPPKIRPAPASSAMVDKCSGEGGNDRSGVGAAISAAASELACRANPSPAVPLRCRRVLSARASDQRHLHTAGSCCLFRRATASHPARHCTQRSKRPSRSPLRCGCHRPTRFTTRW
jgi:hypothetical protein